MAQVATESQWKDKYRELVREIVEKERAWAALEAALRGVAGKLAIAATGRSAELDAAIDQVMAVLRTDPTALELDSSMTVLMRALKAEAAPEPKSGPPAAPDVVEPPTSGVAEEIVVLLRALVRRLAEMPPLAEKAMKLSRRLESGVPENGWDPFLRSVADAVGSVVKALEAQRGELESFLDQVTQQLSGFENWAEQQADATQARHDDTGVLEQTVQVEMRALHQEAVSSLDVGYLKTRIQVRLDGVAQQIREFREKEQQRHAEEEQRTSELRVEIAKLKGRTAELSEICAEQEGRLMIDSLTNTHSRYAYERRIDEEFKRWQRHSQPLSFSILDIDFFKRVNDTYGHDAGDRLLRGVADLVGRNKRAEDFLARLGGEEFVLLLSMTSLEAAKNVVEKLRVSVAHAVFRHHGEAVPVTISCGLTEFRAGDTPATVYERADRALYEAKEGGRNRCVAA